MKIKIILLTIFLLSFTAAAFAQEKIAPKITAIRAQLFQDASGTFSEDILATTDNYLYNTIIGEGAANGKASTSTLVTVEVSGKNFPVGTLKVQITATGDKNRLIQKKLIAADIYDDKIEVLRSALALRYGLRANQHHRRMLIGKGASKTVVKKKIPFRCGE